MKLKLILATLALLGGPAHALKIPEPSEHDPRMQYVDYVSGEVFVINVGIGLGTELVFGADEHLLTVGSGFTDGWQFLEQDNRVYIKARTVKGNEGVLAPISGEWNTNGFIVTNKRRYALDLYLHDGREDGRLWKIPKVAYSVEFRYPEEEAAKARAAAAAAERKKLEQAPPVIRNSSYTMTVGKNSTDIRPVSAYDDGRFTYIGFASTTDIPAIFAVAPDGTESTVDRHIDPSNPAVRVVHQVSREFVLRLGNAVVAVHNEAYVPTSVDQVTSTTKPGTRRYIKDQETEGSLKW